MTKGHSGTDYLAFAHRLADVSGHVISPFFRTRLDVRNKGAHGFFDPVTEADQAAERALRDEIERTYPDHGIFGEEEDRKLSPSPLTWFLDPIDGTRAFMMGNPLWGTLIALAENEQPILGVMDQPFLKERFWAAIGGQAFMRNALGTQSIQTRPCARLEEAVLCTTSPDLFGTDEEKHRFEDLSRLSRLTRYGGDCYNYCLLAAGFIDAIVESGLKPYDVQALIPIVEAAGGIFTTWDGAKGEQGGQILVTGDRRLHDAILARLA